jgi:hypothetical protein
MPKAGEPPSLKEMAVYVREKFVDHCRGILMCEDGKIENHGTIVQHEPWKHSGTHAERLNSRLRFEEMEKLPKVCHCFIP